MSFDDFLKLLTKHYHKHHIAPGVQLAWLNDKAVFYGGVHIFPHGLQSRLVLVKCTADTSGECVSKLYAMWCDATGRPQIPVSTDVPTTNGGRDVGGLDLLND